MCKYKKNHIAEGESFEYINVCTQCIPEFEVQMFKLSPHLRSKIKKKLLARLETKKLYQRIHYSSEKTFQILVCG